MTAAIARTMSDKLTQRQRQIITLIAQGYSRKEIAVKMALSEKALDFHILRKGNDRSIGSRLRFHDPSRLTHFAILVGLVKLGAVV